MKLFDRMKQGLNEALEHAKGHNVPGMRVHVPVDLDVKAIRERAGLSQPSFANSIAVSLGTLRGWEQRRRRPEGPARVLLALLDRNPQIVTDILGVIDPAPRVAARRIARRRGERAGVDASKSKKRSA